MSGKPHVFFIATLSSDRDQLATFSQAVWEFNRDPGGGRTLHTLIPVVGLWRVRKIRDYVLRADEAMRPRHLVEGDRGSKSGCPSTKRLARR